MTASHGFSAILARATVLKLELRNDAKFRIQPIEKDAN